MRPTVITRNTTFQIVPSLADFSYSLPVATPRRKNSALDSPRLALAGIAWLSFYAISFYTASPAALASFFLDYANLIMSRGRPLLL